MHRFVLIVLLTAWTAHSEEPSEQPSRSESPREPASLGRFRGVERFEYTRDVVPGFHVERSLRKGLLIPGIATFAASHAASVLLALTLRDARPAIPVGGAFYVGVKFLEPSSTSGELGSLSTLLGVYFIANGVVQTIGLALTALSICLPNQWLERDAPVQVSVVPTGDRLMLVGQF